MIEQRDDEKPMIGPAGGEEPPREEPLTRPRLISEAQG
jgi:hypothetical protein